MAESISLAKDLNDMHVLTNAIFDSACLAYYERNVSEVERLASNLIELSTRYNFAFFLAIGSILRVGRTAHQVTQPKAFRASRTE